MAKNALRASTRASKKSTKRFKKCWLDFEFNRVTSKYVNLVCAAVLDNAGNVEKFWLHNNQETQTALRDYLSKFKKIVCYSAVAEGRSLISLRLSPLDFRFKDLFVEYRLLSNHNDEINWGKQLVDGKVKRVRKPKPKWEQTEEERKQKGAGFRPTHSLAEASYKMLGVIRDTEHKTAMRDLIISDPKKFTKKQRRDIMDYCVDDVVFLPKLEKAIAKAILEKNRLLEKKTYERQAVERSDYQSCCAISESRGYDINVKATKNFSKQVGSILFDYQREINKLFPDIKPFVWNKREGRFSMKEAVLRDWIENHSGVDIDRWMLTDGKQLSLSLDAFTQHFDFKHNYPKDNFGAQIVGFLKLKQALYGFSANNESSSKKSFWDSVGPDGKVRPYLNGFGAQSSRSQPAATGFMFLKPAWMRALVQPPKGIYYGGIDYGSQEFLISALMSGDKNMIDAYISGDPYFYFAQMAGAIEKGLKRDKKNKKLEKIRDQFKSTVLGLSYQMSCVGLAVKLTQDTGRVWTEEEAQDQIDTFYEVFWRLKEFQEEVEESYNGGDPIILPDGWTMWCDNPNHRSVANCPIQGTGGVILRRATVAAMREGIYSPFQLHDAVYIREKVGMEKSMLRLRDIMRDAFVSVFPPEQKKYAEKIRLDPKIWGPDYKTGVIEIGKEKWKCPTSKLYIDDRAIVDYERFSPYFKDRVEDRFGI